MPPPDQIPVRRALLSVSNKTDIVDFARNLLQLDIELISTGGTAAALRDAGLSVQEVSDLTGFPEIMEGRVKTLHPKIHGGLLGRGEEDASVAEEHGIHPIDLLVVNLYPFHDTIQRPDCTLSEAVENIDVGGPAMLRAAAKNHAYCCAITDPEDYPRVLDALHAGGTDHSLRFDLAIKAFAHTSAYDSEIVWYLEHQQNPDTSLVRHLRLPLERCRELRYGENPHQKAALYRHVGTPEGTLVDATQHQGIDLSYNNLADADAAWECVHSYTGPACVIVKHANPCGVATASNLADAYDAAYRTDPTSAFGGILAFNRPMDKGTVLDILERQFAEVIIAPDYEAEALALLKEKPRIRVLSCNAPDPSPFCAQLHSIQGGLLVQTSDHALLGTQEPRPVTKRAPTEDELRDLLFAWTVAKYVKSNAIVYASGQRTIGVGAGQMSRIHSARIAALKAKEENLPLAGAVMASDAFFPFRDNIDIANEVGITAVIQPGGSIHDDEVISAANEHGMAMLFTGIRHFRH